MSKDNEYIRRATKSFCLTFLDDVLPQLRLTAKSDGYALAVHGSLSDDIDLVAIPWRVGAGSPEELVKKIMGVLGGFVGNCCLSGDAGEKPHGRIAYTIIMNGTPTYIDLSVIKPIEDEDDGE